MGYLDNLDEHSNKYENKFKNDVLHCGQEVLVVGTKLQRML
jgi:hypothetical protein